MGDLRTELFVKVLPKMNQQTQPDSLDNLKFDDGPEDETPVATKESTNITRSIWEYIQANAGVTGVQVDKHFNLNGASSTRLNQLHNKGWVQRVKTKGGTFSYFTKPEHKVYPAEAKSVTLAKAQAARLASIQANAGKPRKVKVVKRKSQPSLSGSSKPASLTSPTQSFDLSKMSVLEARALYEELKKLFGG